jgi:hypothetical protein
VTSLLAGADEQQNPAMGGHEGGIWASIGSFTGDLNQAGSPGNGPPARLVNRWWREEWIGSMSQRGAVMEVAGG